jgi:hypothetical protein
LRANDGTQYGPVDGTIIWDWLRDSRIGPTYYVWREDWPQWRIAQHVFGDYYQYAARVPPAEQSTAPSASHSKVPSGPPPLTAPSAETSGAVLQSSAAQALPTFPEKESLSEQNRRQRQLRRQRNYAIGIIALVILFLGLVTALVVVLTRQ